MKAHAVKHGLRRESNHMDCVLLTIYGFCQNEFTGSSKSSSAAAWKLQSGAPAGARRLIALILTIGGPVYDEMAKQPKHNGGLEAQVCAWAFESAYRLDPCSYQSSSQHSFHRRDLFVKPHSSTIKSVSCVAGLWR